MISELRGFGVYLIYSRWPHIAEKMGEKGCFLEAILILASLALLDRAQFDPQGHHPESRIRWRVKGSGLLAFSQSCKELPCLRAPALSKQADRTAIGSPLR